MLLFYSYRARSRRGARDSASHSELPDWVKELPNHLGAISKKIEAYAESTASSIRSLSQSYGSVLGKLETNSSEYNKLSENIQGLERIVRVGDKDILGHPVHTEGNTRFNALELGLHSLRQLDSAVNVVTERLNWALLLICRESLRNLKARGFRLTEMHGLKGPIDKEGLQEALNEWMYHLNRFVAVIRLYDSEAATKIILVPSSDEMNNDRLARHGRSLPQFILNDPPDAEGLRHLSGPDLYSLRAFWLQWRQLEAIENRLHDIILCSKQGVIPPRVRADPFAARRSQALRASPQLGQGEGAPV
jgi:hypothetical protein